MNEPRSEGGFAPTTNRTLEIYNAPARLNTGSTVFIRCGRPPSDLHLVPSSSYATLQSVQRSDTDRAPSQKRKQAKAAARSSKKKNSSNLL